MITKQQALEFIYELVQKTEVTFDITCGEMHLSRIIDSDYLDTTLSELSKFESIVTKCIKEKMTAIECLGIKNIPVDVDMLEVGQTYKIKYDSYGDIQEITDKLEKIILDKSRRSKYLYFKRSCSIYESLILEIYKVVE